MIYLLELIKGDIVKVKTLLDGEKIVQVVDVKSDWATPMILCDDDNYYTFDEVEKQ